MLGSLLGQLQLDDENVENMENLKKLGIWKIRNNLGSFGIIWDYL